MQKLQPSVKLGVEVNAITQKEQGWQVTSRQQHGLVSQEFDAVILAGTAHGLAPLEINQEKPLSFLSKITYPPIAAVALGYRREDITHALDGFGMLIPGIEKFNILGTLFSSTLFPDRAPPGHVLLSSYVGGARSPELVSLSKETIVEKTHADLVTLLGAKAPPVFSHVECYTKAIPQYELGYAAYLKHMNEFEQKHSGLYLLGNYKGGIALSDTILNALSLAQSV